MTEPERDDLDWDVDRHGRMAEYATGPEGEPKTVPYDQGGWLKPGYTLAYNGTGEAEPVITEDD